MLVLVQPQAQLAYLAIIARLLDNLGCHPVRRAYERVAFGHGARHLSCHAKVCHFDLPSLCHQDVPSFDVAMQLHGT